MRKVNCEKGYCFIKFSTLVVITAELFDMFLDKIFAKQRKRLNTVELDMVSSFLIR